MSGDGGRAAGARVNFAQVSLRLSMSRPSPNRPPPARLPATTLIPRRHLLSAAAAAHCLQLFALFKTVVARRDPSLTQKNAIQIVQSSASFSLTRSRARDRAAIACARVRTPQQAQQPRLCFCV